MTTRPDPRQERLDALLLVVGAGMAFATSGPVSRWSAPAHPLLIVCGRVALASLILIALDGAGTLAALRGLTGRQRLGVAAAGVVLAAHFTLFVWGLQATSLPAAVTLISLEPLSVVLWAAALHGARPSRPEWIGVGLATVGAGLVGRGAGQGEHRPLGDLLVVGAVVLYGLYIAAARSLREALPPRPYAALVYAACAAASGIALLFVPDSPGAIRWPIAGHSMIGIVVLALVPTLLGHTAVQTAARRAPPALVALVSPGETVGGILIGMVWLGMTPSAWEAGGAAIIIAGVSVAIIGIGGIGISSRSRRS